MAKKKIITKDQLLGFYMDYVLTHNHPPKSVYLFAKENNFDEQHFYKHFGSFEALDQHVFTAFFDNALQLLNKSEDYASYDSRNQLLTFYYTFFEILTANRSYVVYKLSGQKDQLRSLQTLRELKKSFTSYIESLHIETLDLKQEQLQKFQNRSLKETAWLQLLVTIKFWLDDNSSSFEKTDIFIEKSVNTSFDLIDVTPLRSLIDLGKFIYKEKIHMS
ncbi:MAG: TetR family transcriptional regulator C-terminal domain-containing protein [Bacteroidota bacterium]